jgi:general L-amino acid transport system permease protein
VRPSALTVLLAVALAAFAFVALRWAVWDAVWWVPVRDGQAETSRCAAAAGACWAVIGEKWRFILFARYPYASQWRPAIACLLIVGLLVASVRRAAWRPALGAAWGVGIVLVLLLMRGGVAGLAPVPPENWGGLPVTLILAVGGLALAFPLAVATAYGRRARSLPGIRALAIAYVELVRGVPLVSLLFMAVVLFPLALPPGVRVETLVAALLAYVLFAGAYLAEVVRGGLQGLPRGQEEAAAALGLSWWEAQRFVVLPQALRAVVPSLVNTAVAVFKDTSLVLIVGVYDLLNAGKIAVASPEWQGEAPEVYLVLAAIYFAFCYGLSRASRGWEIGARG